MELKELVQSWKKLSFDLKKSKKVDFAFFKDVFSQTYALLLQNAQDPCVSRDCAALIAEAYLFAKADVSLDGKYLATLVLTERMLGCCAFKTAPSVSDGAVVYIFEARKEVYISFKDIDESINVLEKFVERKD